jgi:hypothetical protein
MPGETHDDNEELVFEEEPAVGQEDGANTKNAAVLKVLQWGKRKTDWCMKHRVAVLALMGATIAAGHESCEAMDINSLKDDAVAFEGEAMEAILSTNGDLNKLTAVIREKKGQFKALIDRLEEMQKHGVKVRTDFVTEAMAGLKKGKAKASEVDLADTARGYCNKLKRFGSGTCKKAVGKLAGINLDAVPELKKEIDELTAEMTRLRTVLIKMEDRDLKGPTNNYVANTVWSLQSHGDEEKAKVEQIGERKEIREKAVTELFLGFSTTLDGWNASPADIRSLQSVLADVEELPKSKVTGVMDVDTKDAAHSFYDSLLGYFGLLEQIDLSKTASYDQDTKDMQDWLVRIGYLEKDESDGVFGERTLQALIQLRSDFYMTGFKEKPGTMAIFTLAMASE